MAAMVYAANSKPGCYTGFFQPKPATMSFKFMDFLAAQQLPGAGSFVAIIKQPHGSSGPTNWKVLEKTTAVSQIPGMRYEYDVVGNLPRPAKWDGRVMTFAVKEAVQFNSIS